MNYWFLILPVAGAIVGWLIAAFALRFLFHPTTPKKIFGITIMGFIPSQRQKLTDAVVSFTSSFISPKTISDKISEPSNISSVLPVIENHMDDFLRNRLKQEMPMIGMLIGDKTIGTLKTTFLAEIEKMLPLVINKYVGNLGSTQNLQLLISQKLNAIPPSKIESVLAPKLAPLTSKFKLMAALIGFIAGLVQLLIIYLFTR